MSGVNSIIANHFKLCFRNVLNKSGNKIKSRDFFNNVFVIFVSVVMKSHGISVIGIDSGSSNNRTSQVASNVFSNCFRITKIWFCMNIETVFTMIVNQRFHTFKRIAKFAMKFVQECSTKGITEKSVIKMRDFAPKVVVAKPTFRDKAVNMSIPF